MLFAPQVVVASWDTAAYPTLPALLGVANSTPTIRALVPIRTASTDSSDGAVLPPRLVDHVGLRSVDAMVQFADELMPNYVHVVDGQRAWEELTAATTSSGLPRLLVFTRRAATAGACMRSQAGACAAACPCLLRCAKFALTAIRSCPAPDSLTSPDPQGPLDALRGRAHSSGGARASNSITMDGHTCRALQCARVAGSGRAPPALGRRHRFAAPSRRTHLPRHAAFCGAVVWIAARRTRSPARTRLAGCSRPHQGGAVTTTGVRPYYTAVQLGHNSVDSSTAV